MTGKKKISRRDFLRMSGLVALGSGVAACATAPTAAPATEAPATAAPAATQAASCRWQAIRWKNRAHARHQRRELR